MTDDDPTPPLVATTGLTLIANERVRVVRKGLTPQGDVETYSHGQGTSSELLAAAKSYLCAAMWVEDGSAKRGSRIAPYIEWPWEARYWKPTDEVVTNLVKAGQLIAAEIDRLVNTGVG